MRNNLLFKILSSLPVILIALYFIPFLGICLILLRYFIYGNRKRISTPMFIIGVGILILIPKCLSLILDVAKVDLTTIPYLKDIVNAELYNANFMNYSKLLICVGVILLIISFVLKTVFDKISNKLNNQIRDYIAESEQKEIEISQKNDLIMKEKREKAKNTHVVHCPYCGSDNMLTEQTGTCKFCRRKIEYKEESR